MIETAVDGLSTETANERTVDLDIMTVADVLRVMNDEDARVASAVNEALPEIESAVERIVASFRAGGRLIYMGAGSSGRLGVLDAAECVPTFGVPPTMVIALIAGGPEAMTRSVEGAEDDADRGKSDLLELVPTQRDTVVGIAASGRTPYVLGGLACASEAGASTVSVSCNRGSPVSHAVDVAIEVVPGPEILSGSTRLKAGTAQKMVLNMLSTASMIGIGKVYKNLMIDVLATNAKLRMRAEGIVMSAGGVDRDTARRALKESGGSCRIAIVMLLLDCDREEAMKRLKDANDRIRTAVTRKEN